MENINKIKKIIQNTLFIETTLPFGSELFNRHFNDFDFNFIDQYFSDKKKKLFKRAFFSTYTSEENVNHFVNYLIFKDSKIDNWFDFKYSNLSILNFQQSFFYIKKALESADNYKTLEDSLFNSVIIKFKEHSKKGVNMSANDYKMCNSIINHICYILHSDDVDINENIKKEIFQMFNDYVQEHPIATLSQVGYKGIHITKKQINYINEDKQYTEKKTLNFSHLHMFNFDVLKTYPSLKKYIQISLKTREQFEEFNELDLHEIKDYFVEKSKIIEMKSKIQSEVKDKARFHRNQKDIFNNLLKGMEEESVIKLLSNIQLSSCDVKFNSCLILDILLYLDNYGRLNDEHLELLKMSYSI